MNGDQGVVNCIPQTTPYSFTVTLPANVSNGVTEVQITDVRVETNYALPRNRILSTYAGTELSVGESVIITVPFDFDPRVDGIHNTTLVISARSHGCRPDAGLS